MCSLRCTDSLRKKLSAIPSPEREITTVSLKKDVKYGLGESALAFFPSYDKSQSPPPTYISSWHFSVSADVDICLIFLLQGSRSWAERTLAAPISAPSSALSLPAALLMSTGASNLVGCWVSASLFSPCVGVRIEFSFCASLHSFSDFFPSLSQVTASSR